MIRYNRAYQDTTWIWANSKVYVVDPGERLHNYLSAFYTVFKGEPTLYIIDYCSASKAIAKKKDMLLEPAFSGCHGQQSIWVLTQKYNSILTDLRKQARWLAIFHCKDRDSINECLRENDIIPPEEQEVVLRRLAGTKLAKLMLKNDQPTPYQVLIS